MHAHVFHVHVFQVNEIIAGSFHAACSQGRPTYRPGGHRGPTSFAPIAASSRIDRGTLT